MYKHHFRLLRTALQKWMAGDTAPKGMPSYAEFAQGIQEVLQHVRTRHQGRVLVVSSGGPISTAVGLVLGTGNVGKYLSMREDEVNTYMSRDGGLTWLEVRTGSYIYEIGDHGALIVLADNR